VNEADHLRLFSLLPGKQLRLALVRVATLEEKLARWLPFAHSPRFGHLCASLSDTGFGRSASLHLFLPATRMLQDYEGVVGELSRRGLRVRGTYGERSPIVGGVIQVSPRTPGGLSEQDLFTRLEQAAQLLEEQEARSRERLVSEDLTHLEDVVWRA